MSGRGCPGAQGCTAQVVRGSGQAVSGLNWGRFFLAFVTLTILTHEGAWKSLWIMELKEIHFRCEEEN